MDQALKDYVEEKLLELTTDKKVMELLAWGERITLKWDELADCPAVAFDSDLDMDISELEEDETKEIKIPDEDEYQDYVNKDRNRTK
jgi:hypothetical protein